MKQIFLLSLRQLAGRRRLTIILLLAALPVLITTLITVLGDQDNSEFPEIVLGGMLVTAILPIVMIAFATSAFGNEMEDRTLNFLTTKPIPRWQIALPKMLGVITISGPFLLVGGMAATFIGLGGNIQATIAVGVALFVGVTAYSAVFTWAGLVTSHVIGSFLGGVRYLSVRGYTVTIMHNLDQSGLKGLGDQAIEFPAAIVGAIIVTAAFFLLTIYRLRNMDVP
jgi:ABC-type transport system involved in multi-copper enzyme maturation permease subunit